MWFGAQTASSWQDIAALARRMAGNEQQLETDFWQKFKRLVGSLPFAEDLLVVHYCAFDRETPLQVKAVLLGAIAYFVLPTDFIPDYIPLVGYTDDAAVLAAAIKLVTSHITPTHREAARRTLASLRGEKV